MGGPQPAFQQGADKPRREAILDLSKYVDERIRVKFTGGREGESPYPTESPFLLIASILVTGILKGYDQLLNIVLDDVTEEVQRKPLRAASCASSNLTCTRSP